ncbi:MAG: membrane dipeptidase, partial [Gemmatimonadaceae bacterium]
MLRPIPHRAILGHRALALASIAILAPFALLLVASPLQAQATDPNMTRALSVLRTSPVIDGHNDLSWAVRESKTAPRDVDAYDLRQRTVGRTDLARLREGMVGGQFWSVYIPG